MKLHNYKCKAGDDRLSYYQIVVAVLWIALLGATLALVGGCGAAREQAAGSLLGRYAADVRIAFGEYQAIEAELIQADLAGAFDDHEEAMAVVTDPSQRQQATRDLRSIVYKTIERSANATQRRERTDELVWGLNRMSGQFGAAAERRQRLLSQLGGLFVPQGE